MAEPLAKRSLETTLESVPNDLDDEVHARLDKESLKFTGGQHCKPLFLLPTIVFTSKKLLNPDYMDLGKAEVLLEQHPQLNDMLKEAWHRKSFKDIRNLSAYVRVLTKLNVL
jgi:hypothetical protein